MPAAKSDTRIFPGNYNSVFQAVCQAAATSGMTVTLADPTAGVIQMSKSMDLVTWGENLSAYLRPVSSGVEVTLSSALKFGLVDWGRNRQNIEALFHRIAQPPAGAWHSDPSGRHELRWWDGTRWTDTVSNHGQVGQDPL
jgi:hypothetical protein